MNDRIVLDSNICHGKPVVRGTRVPVARVLGYLAGGMSYEDVEKDYGLTPEDIQAVLAYAADVLSQEQHHPLPT